MAQDEFPEHIASTLAYLFVFLGAILLLVMEPYSKNKIIRVHAWQSIFTSVSFMGIWYVALLLTKILGSYAFLTYLLTTVMITAWFMFLGIWFYAMFQSYNRFPVELPIISRLAQKFA